MKNEFNCKDIVITEQNTKALIISKDDENSILDTVIRLWDVPFYVYPLVSQ